MEIKRSWIKYIIKNITIIIIINNNYYYYYDYDQLKKRIQNMLKPPIWMINFKWILVQLM